MIPEKRLTNIDLLESIAIFFVILYHSTLYSFDIVQTFSGKNCFLYFFRTILSTCVPLFFFANGYLLFNRNYSIDKHVKKIAKLVLLTFIWAFILMPLYLIIKNEPLSIKKIILSILNLNIEWGMNFFWFIGALVCMYLLFPALKLLFDSDKKTFFYFTVTVAFFTFGFVLGNQVLAVFGYLIHHELGTVNYPIIQMFNPFRGSYGYSFVYFCFGGLLYTFEGRIRSVCERKRNIIAIIGIFLSCLFLFFVGMFYSVCRDGKLWDVVWNGYDTIFTFFNVLFIYLLCLNCYRDVALVRLISQNTLGIYFTHGLIIRLTRPWIKEIEALCNLPFNILYAVIILFSCLFLCLILKRIPIMKKLVK